MNVLTLLCSDFGKVVTGITEGTLTATDVVFEKAATVCKYPGT